MKYLLTLISAIIIFSNSFAFVESETNGDNLISFNGVSNIKLGMSLTELKDSLKGFNFDYYDGFGYYITNSDTSFQLIVNTEVNSDIINSIEIVNSNYYLKNGIKVGSSLKEFKKFYPQLKLNFLLHGSGECFFYYNSDSPRLIIFRTDS